MMQFLVESRNKALTMIYRRSIIVENVRASLSIGETIKFLWPEDSPKAKEYSGVIIAKSRKYHSYFFENICIFNQI